MDKCLKTLGKIIDKLQLEQVEIIRDLDMMTQLQVYKFIESLNTVLEGKKLKQYFTMIIKNYPQLKIGIK